MLILLVINRLQKHLAAQIPLVVIILDNFAIIQRTFCQSVYRDPQGSLMG
jgi:hypothetical protein